VKNHGLTAAMYARFPEVSTGAGIAPSALRCCESVSVAPINLERTLVAMLATPLTSDESEVPAEDKAEFAELVVRDIGQPELNCIFVDHRDQLRT
jgi:hypothetical protein